MSADPDALIAEGLADITNVPPGGSLDVRASMATAKALLSIAASLRPPEDKALVGDLPSQPKAGGQRWPQWVEPVQAAFEYLNATHGYAPPEDKWRQNVALALGQILRSADAVAPCQDCAEAHNWLDTITGIPRASGGVELTVADRLRATLGEL